MGYKLKHFCEACTVLLTVPVLAAGAKLGVGEGEGMEPPAPWPAPSPAPCPAPCLQTGGVTVHRHTLHLDSGHCTSLHCIWTLNYAADPELPDDSPRAAPVRVQAVELAAVLVPLDAVYLLVHLGSVPAQFISSDKYNVYVIKLTMNLREVLDSYYYYNNV